MAGMLQFYQIADQGCLALAYIERGHTMYGHVAIDQHYARRIACTEILGMLKVNP